MNEELPPSKKNENQRQTGAEPAWDVKASMRVRASLNASQPSELAPPQGTIMWLLPFGLRANVQYISAELLH